MTYRRKIAAKIHRMGRVVDVYARTETGQNEFGNMTDDHSVDRQVIAFRTYPNRNTDIEGNIGDYSQDRPVFLVPIGDNQPTPPQVDELIEYDGQKYEVNSHTPYETHVEFFGDPVIHDESGE